jgi:hypothetical protein
MRVDNLTAANRGQTSKKAAQRREKSRKLRNFWVAFPALLM